MKVANRLFKAARRARDMEVVLSGSPRRIARRLVNKYILKKVTKNVLFHGPFQK